jgi:hypothetical protein
MLQRLESAMQWRIWPQAAHEIERTAQLIHEARELQAGHCFDRLTELIGGSRRQLALSRVLLAKPVFNPFREESARPTTDEAPSGCHRDG